MKVTTPAAAPDFQSPATTLPQDDQTQAPRRPLDGIEAEIESTTGLCLSSGLVETLGKHHLVCPVAEETSW